MPKSNNSKSASNAPKLIVVDDNDVVIAYKTWAEVLPTDRVRISAIYITNSQGQLLIAQRSRFKKHQPLLWGPSAAGTVESTETYDSNAYKELAEEIGLIGIKLQKVSNIKWDNGPSDKRFCTCYIGKCDWPIEEFKLQYDEVDAVQWISLEDLLQDSDENPEKYLPKVKDWLANFNLVDKE